MERPAAKRAAKAPAAGRTARARAAAETGADQPTGGRKIAAKTDSGADQPTGANNTATKTETGADQPTGADKIAVKAETDDDQPTGVKKARKAANTTVSAQKAVALVGGSDVARTNAEDGRAASVRILDRPGHAPELLALAAVRAVGPQARDWAAQTRATYPAATADGLARLATRRFVRMAGAGGAVSAAFGLLTPVAELTATAWAQAALVLHMAAGYGHDPLDEERAVDLLVLVGVHPSAEVARARLADATAADLEFEGAPALRAAEAAWRLAMPISNQSRGWVALRMVARRLPGVVPVTAALGAAAAVERLAYRTRAHYRAG